jgi:hypothetical protein
LTEEQLTSAVAQVPITDNRTNSDTPTPLPLTQKAFGLKYSGAALEHTMMSAKEGLDVKVPGITNFVK